MKKLLVASVFLLTACATNGTGPDVAQTVYALGQTYVTLNTVAQTYVNSPNANVTVVTNIRKANEAADMALDSAVAAISACPYVNGKYDTTCTSSAAVTASIAAATQAVLALEANLAANQIKVQ